MLSPSRQLQLVIALTHNILQTDLTHYAEKVLLYFDLIYSYLESSYKQLTLNFLTH